MNVEIGAEAALFPEKEYIKEILSVTTPTFWRTFHRLWWNVQQKAAIATLCVLCGVCKHALKGVQKMAGPLSKLLPLLAPEPELGQRNSPEYLMIFSLLSSVFPLLYWVPPDGKKTGEEN